MEIFDFQTMFNLFGIYGVFLILFVFAAREILKKDEKILEQFEKFNSRIIEILNENHRSCRELQEMLKKLNEKLK